MIFGRMGLESDGACRRKKFPGCIKLCMCTEPTAFEPVEADSWCHRGTSMTANATSVAVASEECTVVNGYKFIIISMTVAKVQQWTSGVR
jgi:hypothetical protein